MTILVDDEVELLANRLARLRGETVEQALKAAVSEALRRVEPISPAPDPIPIVRRAADPGKTGISLVVSNDAPPIVLDPFDPLGSLTPAQRAKVERSIASINLLPPMPQGDLTEEFYDENGLPR